MSRLLLLLVVVPGAAATAMGSITRAKGIASFEAIKDHARRKEDTLKSSYG